MSAKPGARPGLVAAIGAAYGDLRASMARQLAAGPGEPQLLFYVFLASGLGFVAGLPGAVRQAKALAEPDALAAVLAGRLFAALFLAPLALYGLAALARLAARVFGGAGSYRASRLALFWGLLVALPLLLGAALIGALTPPGSAPAALASGLAALGFLWIWANFLAEAEGFASRIRVFATILGLALLLPAISLIFRGF